MRCLILAGGFATRLYPLTINKAKALLEYRGKPVISHIVGRVPPDVSILVATNKKFEQDFIAWQKTLDRPVEICIEEAMTNEQKKGAIGSIDFWTREKDIAEDLIVIAADNYFEIEMTDLVKSYNEKNTVIAVYDVGDKDKACDVARTCQVGLVILEENRVLRFDEKPIKATSSIIATGIYILPSRIFPLLSRYCGEGRRDNLGSFITYLLEQGERVYAYTMNGVWLDIGDEIMRGRLSI